MDPHTEMILEEYDQQLPLFRRLERIVQITLQDILDKNGLMVTAVTTRIKTRESLAGKLELKGSKYHSISDITDVLGGVSSRCSCPCRALLAP